MSQYFFKSYENSDGNLKVALDLSNHVKKPIWIEQQVLIHLRWHQKEILLAWKLDILDMYELKTSSADLSKLSTVVGNDVAKNNL